MSRYICIHGHFYQPPRENPWLEEIELQDSAYPHHDWNSRITAECYAPNTAARIFEDGRRLMDIVNNYSMISFNFGPTLLFWMEENRPDIYKAILGADKVGSKRFSGHGPALAQAYNHMIMPLANSRDKRTQIIWGLKDFEHRFGRKAEGMWLPETAVDYESLEIMAELGLRFTILAPRQASEVKKIGAKEWIDVSESRVDPKMPYLCHLPSGKTITIFFYDGPISQDIGFGRLLNSGEGFAHRLISAFAEENGGDQLVHIATDGETYGHHHAFGDMALAYCLHFIEKNKLAQVTIYGEYLDRVQPTHEARIFENSSWSCVHGVERWKSNCGCNTGGSSGWNQEWRGPLRGALDWLRDNLTQIYESQSEGLIKDPWKARDEYIKVILDRSEKKVEAFLKKYALKELEAVDKTKMLRLFEMQRNAMLMFTSCAWFFDEISGIEPVQVLGYAARAMQLAQDVSDISLEEAFISLLEHAPTNIPEHINGAEIYRKFVKPSVLDLLRVGIHYGVSSLFHDYPEMTQIYTYRVVNHAFDRAVVGIQKMVVGRISVRSRITWAEGDMSYAVLHLGDHNIVGGARYYLGEEAFREMDQSLKDSFSRGDLTESIRLIDSNFSDHNVTLWHLFRDEQQMVLYKIFDHTMREIENSLRQIYGYLSPVMRALQGGRMRIPKYFSMVLEFLLETDIRKALESLEVNFVELEAFATQAHQWPLNLDKATLGYVASERIEQYMEEWAKAPRELEPLEKASRLTGICTGLGLKLDLWRTQTLYFLKGHELLSEMRRKADDCNERARKWMEAYMKLGEYQNIRVE